MVAAAKHTLFWGWQVSLFVDVFFNLFFVSFWKGYGEIR